MTTHRSTAAARSEGSDSIRKAKAGKTRDVEIADGRVDDKRVAIVDDLPRHLRALARQVQWIGTGYRQGPEAMASEKDRIAHALRSFAALLEGG
jgi:hypothetical protein